MSDPDYDSADEWAAPPKALETTEQKVVEVDINAMAPEDKELAGGVVPVRFKFSNGAEDLVCKFLLGQTVGHMKQQIEHLRQISYEKLTLKLADKTLIDPLSLNDLPFAADAESTVDVTVA